MVKQEYRLLASDLQRDVSYTSSTLDMPDFAEKLVAGAALSIVTNSRLLSEGLISLLQTHLSLSHLHIYAGDLQVSAALPNPAGHVILLDSSIGRGIVIEHIKGWRKLASAPAVVVLELANDVEFIVTCIEAGANGYVLQGATIAEVAYTILQVQKGIAQCSPEVTAQLFDRLARLSTKQISSRVSLTPREMDILTCLARGCSNKEIAQELVIEVRTVKHHVHNILDKLKVPHRWDAARLALEQGWLIVS